MKYIYNSNNISELIKVTEELYLRYKDVLNVKYKSDEYYYLIGELTRLSKIEDDFLLSLPSVGRLLDDVNNNIKTTYKCDDILMYIFVLNRIDSNICNLCALAEEKELSNISNISLIDSQDNINSINEELYYNFVMRLDNVIDSVSDLKEKRKIRFIQLAHIFSFKYLSDSFIENNLCLDIDFNKRRENIFDDVDSYNSFMYLRNNIAFNLCESLLMRNITFSSYYNDDDSNLFYLSNILLFKSLLQDINDPDFIEIKNSYMFDYNVFKEDNFIINKIKKCFDYEYNRRFSQEKNERVQSLDEKNAINLINLLKLEDVLYDKFMNLRLDGFDDFNLISSLVAFEKDLIDELDINKDNISIVSSVIDRDLEFFIDVYDNLFKKKSIIQRLKNGISYFRKNELADGVLEKNYDSIISNHIVDSLKMFDGDLSIIKSYIFMYPYLTDDLVLLNGNYSMIDRFSDETVSISLGNKNVYNYYYDKNEQLYKLFTILMDDLTRYSDMYESEWLSLFNFKICELSDIINSVSDEHLFHIKDEILSLDKCMVKEKLLSLLNNKVH